MNGFTQQGMMGHNGGPPIDYSKPYGGSKPTFNSFQSPVGRFVHLFHDKPSMDVHEKTNQPLLDEKGFQKAKWKATLIWPKRLFDTELVPFRQLAQQSIDQAWPVRDNWFSLETFLRDGDNPQHNTKRKEYLFGHYYLNFNQKADPIVNQQTGALMGYGGNPGITGPYGTEDLLPTDIWAGCTGRVSGIMFCTHYSGKNFVSVRLNNLQLAAQGERIGGGGRPDAKSQFDPLMQPGMAQQPAMGTTMTLMGQNPQLGYQQPQQPALGGLPAFSFDPNRR